MEPLAIALRSSQDIGAIQVGSIWECLALCANDLILFLRDPRQSLKAALTIMNNFATFSGLKVNWDKSSIFATGCWGQRWGWSQSHLFTYLGVQVTANVRDYMSLNLLPLVSQLKQIVQAWKKLPLSLIGRINLLKRKYFQLYCISPFPKLDTKSYFKKLDSIIGQFLWSPMAARIGLKVLQVPWGQGCLAQRVFA